jgi:hypothetical protein
VTVCTYNCCRHAEVRLMSDLLTPNESQRLNGQGDDQMDTASALDGQSNNSNINASTTTGVKKRLFDRLSPAENEPSSKASKREIDDIIEYIDTITVFMNGLAKRMDIAEGRKITKGATKS